MAVNGILSLQSSPAGFMEAINSRREPLIASSAEVEAGISSAVTGVRSVKSTGSASGIMARHFVSEDEGPSRYVQATMKAKEQEAGLRQQERTQLTSIMLAAKSQYEQAETTGEKYKILKQAERRIMLHIKDEVEQAAEDGHLKEAKERLENGAQKAMAPKDENGDPIQTVPNADATGGADTLEEQIPASKSEVEALSVTESQSFQVFAQAAVTAYSVVSSGDESPKMVSVNTVA